jgi:hypothetical protein
LGICKAVFSLQESGDQSLLEDDFSLLDVGGEVATMLSCDETVLRLYHIRESEREREREREIEESDEHSM